jgi:isoamylase
MDAALLGRGNARRRLPLRPGPALAREAGKVENLGGFFDAIRAGPGAQPVKLIAEPWDLGHNGYQVGNFPLGWAEWNGQLPRQHARLLARRRRLLGEVAKPA